MKHDWKKYIVDQTKPKTIESMEELAEHYYKLLDKQYKKQDAIFNELVTILQDIKGYYYEVTDSDDFLKAINKLDKLIEENF